MNTEKPKLSICIPTYRYGRFIAQAIDSVLAQDYEDFELLIVDDASPDNTRQVVDPYLARDRRIRFEVNSTNRGMVPNWNYCLEQARGEYLKFLFADDFLCSVNALSSMVELLDSDAAVSLVFSARHFVDEGGTSFKLVRPFGTDICRMSGEKLIKHCLARMNNPIGEPSTVMFRKKEGMRGFDSRFQQLVDLEMWLHLLEQGDAYYLPEPLSVFRVHGAQQTTVNVQFLQNDRLLLVREYLGDSKFLKRYLEYCQYYTWWKLARKSTPEAQNQVFVRIAARYPLWKFYGLLPVYKLLTPLYKLLTPIIYRA
jgi:glycosyltransferase involved in cell wall biosynthesis